MAKLKPFVKNIIIATMLILPGTINNTPRIPVFLEYAASIVTLGAASFVLYTIGATSLTCAKTCAKQIFSYDIRRAAHLYKIGRTGNIVTEIIKKFPTQTYMLQHSKKFLTCTNILKAAGLIAATIGFVAHRSREKILTGIISDITLICRKTLHSPTGTEPSVNDDNICDSHGWILLKRCGISYSPYW